MSCSSKLLILLCIISLVLLMVNYLLPYFLRFFSVFAGSSNLKSHGTVARISIIIPAYNEENNIKDKIDSLWNSLQRVKIEAEVLIGSDGSTDRTVAIASDYLKGLKAASWRVIEFQNEGKCNTINKLVNLARGDVIISTDADILVPENAIEIILSSFNSNQNLGCLSCIPVLRSERIGSQRTYWSLEDRIRDEESLLGKLIVVTGWLYAFRKDAFVQIPSGVMADDLWVPLSTLLKGYDCIQDKNLRVQSETTDDNTEVKRRKRVISGGMDVVWRLLPDLFNKPSILFLVLVHKVNRWAIPLWLFLFIATSVFISAWLLLVYLAGFAAVYLFLGRERLLTLLNSIFSPLLCFVEVLRKNDFARWEHTRTNDSE